MAAGKGAEDRGEAGKEEERGRSVLVSTIQKKARKEKYMRDTATNQ